MLTVLETRKLFVVLVSVGAILSFMAITKLYWDKTYPMADVVRTVLQQTKEKHNDTVKFVQSLFLTDESLGNHGKEAFRVDGPCPYFGLRKPDSSGVKKNEMETIACKPHRPSADACSQAKRTFGNPGTKQNKVCGETSHPAICKFLEPEGEALKQKLSCDIGVCGGKVSVGAVDKDLGKIAKWQSASSTDDVLKIVQSTFKDGFQFCFLKCAEIKQVLWFPHKLKINGKIKASERININILLLDSLSRPHFYRVLPRAVEALREIVYNKSIPATALDFELLQGIGQHTFENIRPIFSGLVGGNEDFSSKVKKAEIPLGLAVLYGKYQSLGYQTIFQEDLCWFDHWGVILTDLERRSAPSSDSEYKSRWDEYKKKISKYKLDDVGLTHFSCEVFAKYSQTNPYDQPDKICLNGQFFEKYFLDYVTAMFQSIQRRPLAAPILAYQHFDTAHTPYGTRIVNLDGILAEYFRNMAYDKSTLTFVLADHGHTRTSYAETLEGRFELFNPTMFMIIPNHVAHLLGKERMAALVKNQKRLFTTVDIHKALMTLHDQSPSGDYRTAGIFAPIAMNRTCEDLPLLPLTRCKCDGWDHAVVDNAPKHKWLAERALGNINNNIQEQYTKDNKGKGYGHCMRLQGLSYRNILEHQEKENLVTTFDLHVAPPRGLKDDETFKVALRHSIKPRDGVDVKNVLRHSMYKDFATCQDTSVDIKLCVCEQGANGSFIETKEDMMSVISRPQFGAKTQLTDLHSGCLYLMTRKHDKMTIAYEVANVCVEKTFRVVMTVKASYNMMMTRYLPVDFRVEPKTIHFVVSAVRYVLNDSNLDIDTTVSLV